MTHVKLRMREIIIVTHLCGDAAETVGHLVLHCRITDQLWKIFINLRGIYGQCLARLLTLFLAGKRLGLGQEIEAIRGSSQLAYGGLSKKKGIPDVSRIDVAPYTRSNQTVFCYFVFGVQRA